MFTRRPKWASSLFVSQVARKRQPPQKRKIKIQLNQWNDVQHMASAIASNEEHFLLQDDDWWSNIANILAKKVYMVILRIFRWIIILLLEILISEELIRNSQNYIFALKEMPEKKWSLWSLDNLLCHLSIERLTYRVK